MTTNMIPVTQQNPLTEKKQSKLLSLNYLKICNGAPVVIDTETTGLYWWKHQMIGLGVHCPDRGVTGYIECRDNPEKRAEIKHIIEGWSEDTIIIAHNLKFDFHFIAVNPGYKRWKIIDTTELIHLIDSRHKKSLEKAEEIFLGTNSKRNHITNAPAKAKTKVWTWPLETIIDYCINDCIVTMQLVEVLVPKIREWGLIKIFVKDMKYLCRLWQMERHGFALDVPYVEKARVILDASLDTMVEELHDAVGYEFNWRSPQQLSKAIYDDLGIARPKNPFAGADGIDRSKFAVKAKYNSCMTSTFILMEKAHHPLGELILHIREAAKLKKTLEIWLELKDENNVIHSNFNLTGTRTARLSSKKPNLQNVASEVRGRYTQSVFSGEEMTRTEEYNLRKAFISSPGYVLLSIDWKQMEMRMFGILSHDPFMLDSLEAGRDIHGDIAEKVWGLRDKVHREWSKTISFGLIYGMTIGSLMYRLNMSRAEANRVTKEYWNEFPRIKPWLDEIIAECKIAEYVRYWTGRLWREENPIHMYKGANAVIQGGCAEILSIATLRVCDYFDTLPYDCYLVNLIHDEIISEVPEQYVLEVARKKASLMEVPDLLGIVFTTDTKIGYSYGGLVDIPKEILEDTSQIALPEGLLSERALLLP